MASDRSLLREAIARRGGGSSTKNSSNDQSHGASAPFATAPPSSESTERREAVTEPLPEPEDEAPLKRKDPDTDANESADAKRVRHDTLDDEWAEFQRTVVAPANDTSANHYEHAIISAEPELRSTTQAETPYEQEESQAEQRARLDREAREEILARIEEEQRAQEDADERVQHLRTRLARIKQARQRRAEHAPAEA
ncbi:hypothetical protein MEQU1_002728 [Malassezia equina]|uniref:Uncharacterized protein n=1 Tax=Malassezia equina TaxID=1381935 RepID=A0AAF0EJQ6_9BASI|nr:hypothetical protein MEQU1_002728 [Malassezia equina]